MIKIKKAELDIIIESISSSLFEQWKIKNNEDENPAIEVEPPLDRELTIIDPKSDIQFSGQNLPIKDPNWVPGNKQDLGMAMRQMSEMVPENQMDWFYSKMRKLIDHALDQEDGGRMEPRLD